MARQLKRLLKHYGIDEAKPKASKQLIKRIENDMARYVAQAEQAIEERVTLDPRNIVVDKRVKKHVGDRLITGQTSLSGRSLGRSSGPVKKSGANKRSGGGREHGECMGASSRRTLETVPVYQVEPTFKKVKTGKKLNTQLKHIVEAYTALLELVR